MSKLVTFQLDSDLVEPLIETLESRAQAWQETTRLLRVSRPKDNALPSPEAVQADRMASLYAALIEKISNQMDGV